MSKLKACPFCGGTDVLSERDGVHCEECGGAVGDKARWNRREPDYKELARELVKVEMELSIGDDCYSCYTDHDRPHCGEGNSCCRRIVMLKAVKAGLLEGQR
jgi:hypothetical protein